MDKSLNRSGTGATIDFPTPAAAHAKRSFAAFPKVKKERRRGKEKN